MTNRMTKKNYFETIKSLLADHADIVEFCDHELELLAKRNSSERKPTAQQVANDSTKENILQFMEDNRLYTITEIQTALGSEFSNQRVSALVRQLMDSGKVERICEKRKAFFRRVTE